jgi:streptogramin lyase
MLAGAQNGDYWVANGNNSTSLSRFTPKGKMTVFQIGYIPLEITVDQNGNFWLTNQEYENQIIRVTPTLKVTSFSLTDDAYGGITLGGDGNIWFVETDYIGELTPGGKLTEYPTPDHPRRVRPGLVPRRPSMVQRLQQPGSVLRIGKPRP